MKVAMASGKQQGISLTIPLGHPGTVFLSANDQIDGKMGDEQRGGNVFWITFDGSLRLPRLSFRLC
jgi:hypothetical protein